MKTKIWHSVVLFMLLAFAWPLPAQAGALPNGKVIMGGSYTLASGEMLGDDLVIFGGEVTIEEGATVQGDVALLGGSLDIAGTVQGDVAAFGGSLTLRDTAFVGGDLVALGTEVERSPEAFIGGQVVEEDEVPFNFDLEKQFSFNKSLDVPRQTPLDIAGRLVFRTLGFLFDVFMLSALAVLVIMFLETPVRRIARTVVEQPMLSGGVGCMTLMVTPFLLGIIALTVILLPVSLVGLLALFLLALYGWVALGYEVGRRVAAAARQTWSAPLMAGVGTLLITLVIGGIGKAVPCIGWAIPWVAAGVGLGAVILTQLGAQDYPPLGGAPLSGVARPSEDESAPSPTPELPPVSDETLPPEDES